MNRWVPLARSGERDLVLLTLRETTDRMHDTAVRDGNAWSLLTTAYTLGHLSRLEGFADCRGKAEIAFGRAVQQIAEINRTSLFEGYVGLAWMGSRLARLLDWDIESLCIKVDEKVSSHLDRLRPGAPYELMYGVTGIGIYAIERRSMELLEKVTRHLSMSAEWSNVGVRWLTQCKHLHPSMQPHMPGGYYNCGLAHGTPAILYFLAAVASVGLDTRPMIDAGVDWLLATLNPSGDLPSWVQPGELLGAGESTRIGWCYGNLGTAVALLQAAKGIGHKPLHDFAISLAQKAAERPLHLSEAEDAHFCHGAMGNAHMFNRLHCLTGESAYLDVARAYFTWGLKLHSTSVGGADLLDGDGGVCLCLLSALSGDDPTWDHLFLLGPVGSEV